MPHCWGHRNLCEGYFLWVDFLSNSYDACNQVSNDCSSRVGCAYHASPCYRDRKDPYHDRGQLSNDHANCGHEDYVLS